MKAKLLPFILFIICIQITINAQLTQSVFIDVGGLGPTSDICSDATEGMAGVEDIDQEYDCTIAALGLPTLLNGPYSFTAPTIPPGMGLIRLEVILINQVCSSNITISLESEMLMLMVTKPCIIDEIDCPDLTTREFVSFDCTTTPTTSLNFGGLNQFDIMADLSGDGGICLSHVEIIFTFDTCCKPAIPDFVPNKTSHTTNN